MHFNVFNVKGLHSYIQLILIIIISVAVNLTTTKKRRFFLINLRSNMDESLVFPLNWTIRPQLFLLKMEEVLSSLLVH